MRRERLTTIVISASASHASRCRSTLERLGAPDVCVTDDVRALRRSLVRGDTGRHMLLCVNLDSSTLDALHGPISRLLVDRRAFPARIHAVGVLEGGGFPVEAAELGCDLYLDGLALLTRALRHWLDFTPWTNGRPIADCTSAHPHRSRVGQAIEPIAAALHRRQLVARRLYGHSPFDDEERG